MQNLPEWYWRVLLGLSEMKRNCLWFHSGKVCKSMIKVQTGSLNTQWMRYRYITSFNTLEIDMDLFPWIESLARWAGEKNNFTHEFQISHSVQWYTLLVGAAQNVISVNIGLHATTINNYITHVLLAFKFCAWYSIKDLNQVLNGPKHARSISFHSLRL